MFTRTARFYDAIYGTMKDYANESARVADAIQARNPSAATLLDVACGTGAHLSFWSRRFECEGLDADPQILAVAAERLPGVPLHRASMTDFDLGKRFDAVTCLFSSIGYTQTLEAMRGAVARMAAHLNPGGVLVVEPWLAPSEFQAGLMHAVVVDEPDLKIARFDRTFRDDRRAWLEFDYMIMTPDGVVHEQERHDTGLFTAGEQLDALRDAGLAAEHDEDGLWATPNQRSRGMFFGVKNRR